MKRTLKLVVLAVVFLSADAGQSQADQIFNFSFTNTLGNVNGTVTGEIDLPFNGSGTGAASHVYIDSYPTALGNVGSLPIDTRMWISVTEDQFTVTSGQLSFVSFVAGTTSPQSSVFNLAGPIPSESLLTTSTSPTDHPFVEGPPTFSGPTRTPEPASITLLVSGFLTASGFGIYRRRRGRATELSPAN
jgi:hypothetical protein